MVEEEKDKLTIVYIGHVDSGKSTTSGRLCYETGVVDKRTMEKLEKDSAEMGKPSFKYAWVFDRTRAERERGITVESGNIKMETKKKIVTILDAPGHRDFLKNMISSASSADFAVVVIPVTTGEAETALSKSGSVREHILLVRSLGTKGLIVILNKMDAIDYNEARYNEIKKETMNIIKKAGFNPDQTPFIPVSGWCGDNITEVSKNMPWFKGFVFQSKDPVKNIMQECKGFTLLECIDCLHAPVRMTDKPLRLPIHDTFKISGVGTVPTGRIETGILKPGMIVHIAPVGILTEVKSVEMHHVSLDMASPGDNVGLNVKNVAVSDLRRGFVIGDSKNDPPCWVEKFDAQVMIVNELSKATSGIHEGYSPSIDIHTAHIPCTFFKILHKVDKRSGKPMELVDDETGHLLKNNEAALVAMVAKSPMSCEKFSEYPPLGRFGVRDSRVVVAVGVIKEIYKKVIDAKGGGVKGAKVAAKPAAGKAKK